MNHKRDAVKERCAWYVWSRSYEFLGLSYGTGLCLDKLKRPCKTVILIGRGERTQTFDLSVPNRARYQLRHTPIGGNLCNYTAEK